MYNKYMNSEEYCKIMHTLKTSKATIYPNNKDMLKAFLLCKEEDIKVVILGQDPYHDGSATGLAFANTTSKISPSLRIISERVMSLYDTNDFDYSLVRWANQGVLLLNTALTVEAGKAGSHLSLWKNFMTDFIFNISNDKKDLIFVLWGRHAQSFQEYIKSSFIFSYNHPAYSIYTGKSWECNSFIHVNNTLDALNKKSILW